MKQPGLKHYCKNCAVKRYFNFGTDKSGVQNATVRLLTI